MTQHINGNGNAKASRSYLCYLPCQAEPGMFKGELLVYLEGYDPSSPDEPIKVQMLVDRSDVKQLAGEPKRHNPVYGIVQVTLISGLGEREGIAEVILPQPAQPVGERLLVNASNLIQEAKR